MSSTTVMKAKARLIKEETQEGANTAARVGGLFEDIVDYLDSADVTSSLEITPYVTTGTRIAKFKVNGEETIIFAPSNGGSGGSGSGGGGSSSDGSKIPEIQAAIEALDDALEDTTKLANDEKKRLDDLVKGIGEDISGRMKDALEYAEWIRGNHPEGETFFESGWNDKTKEFMQTVGLWDTDEATTRTRWSYYRQNYNTIAAAVSAINQDGNFSTFLQGLIEETITDESVQTSISNTYAKKDDTADIINWMYSALKGSASEYETFNDLVSAASNGTSSAISEVRTYVNKLKNNEYVAVANIAAKVDDAITELYQQAGAGYSSTSIFSTVKQDSADIAALVQKITNDTSSTTVANKIAQWQAGFVTQATLEGAFASMLATDSDHSTVSAIVTSVNNAGSSVQISANNIEFTGQTINATVSGGLAINNGKQGGGGQYSYLITANDNDGLKIDSRGGNADISIFNIDKYGNITHTYNNIERFAFDRDGSGHLASGHLIWNNDGDLSITSTYTEQDAFGSDITKNGIAEFASYGFELRYEVNDVPTSYFRVSSNGSIVQHINDSVNNADVFASNYNGAGFIGISDSTNSNNHPIIWSNNTVQLFDLVTVSKGVAPGDSISIASTGFNVGNYSFKVVTIGSSSYLRISTGGTTGLYMNASGKLGVVVNNSFKPSLDFDDYYSHHSTRTPGLGEFLTNTGSDINNYYIRNGLIVEG